MALVKCGECGKQISDKAAACPNCGAPPSEHRGEAPSPSPATVAMYNADRRKTNRYFVLAVIGVAALVGLAIKFGGGRSTDAPVVASQPNEAAAKERAEIQARDMANATRECTDQIEDKLRQHAALLAEGKADDARHVVSRCALLTKDERYRTANLLALHQADIKTMADRKASELARVTAYDALPKELEAIKAPHERAIAGLRKKAERQAVKEAEARAEQDRQNEYAKRWKNTVRIGQSEGDVLALGWGRPDKINRTTSAYGVREQWVYDNKYLYFENGILRTIQD